jgi:hypothetical protein
MAKNDMRSNYNQTSSITLPGTDIAFAGSEKNTPLELPNNQEDKTTPFFINKTFSNNKAGEKLATLHSTSRNNVEFYPELMKIYKLAIANQDEFLIAKLIKLTKLKPEDREYGAKQARDLGNVTIVNMLSHNDLYYFADLLNDNTALAHAIDLAYRNSNMQHVDELCVKYINDLDKNKVIQKEKIEQIKAIVYQCRKKFLDYGPFIVRHTEEKYLSEMAKNYCPKSKPSLANDIALGLSKLKALSVLPSTSNVFFTDIFTETFTLPKDFTDSRPCHSARSFLYQFSEAQYLRAEERGDIAASEYHTIHNNNIRCSYTPMTHRYKQMKIIAHHMLNATLTLPNTLFIKPFELRDGYDLYYQGTHLSRISLKRKIIKHGLASVQTIWPVIEKLNAEIAQMTRHEIEKNPHLFYDSVIEFIWLMGNLTPMHRGTGCYVETFLAHFHRQHDLPMPILKRGYQLDCLNISHSLNIYKKIFLNYFEPNSLASFVVEDHMKRYKSDQEMQFLAKVFDLFPSPQCIAPEKPLALSTSTQALDTKESEPTDKNSIKLMSTAYLTMQLPTLPLALLKEKKSKPNPDEAKNGFAYLPGYLQRDLSDDDIITNDPQTQYKKLHSQVFINDGSSPVGIYEIQHIHHNSNAFFQSLQRQYYTDFNQSTLELATKTNDLITKNLDRALPDAQRIINNINENIDINKLSFSLLLQWQSVINCASQLLDASILQAKKNNTDTSGMSLTKHKLDEKIEAIIQILEQTNLPAIVDKYILYQSDDSVRTRLRETIPKRKHNETHSVFAQRLKEAINKLSATEATAMKKYLNEAISAPNPSTKNSDDIWTAPEL